MKAGAAAKRLGVTVKTMQRWEREGRLMPVARSRSNQRLYTESQLVGLSLGSIPTVCRPGWWHIAGYRACALLASRLDGLRNYRKKLNEALKQDADGHATGTSHPA